MYIACSRCDWRPDENAVWRCECGHVWNTFETQGLCPVCYRQWDKTMCRLCNEWTDHVDWYHDDDDLTVAEFIAWFKDESDTQR